VALPFLIVGTQIVGKGLDGWFSFHIGSWRFRHPPQAGGVAL
jgi:hypothetical protein